MNAWKLMKSFKLERWKMKNVKERLKRVNSKKRRGKKRKQNWKNRKNENFSKSFLINTEQSITSNLTKNAVFAVSFGEKTAEGVAAWGVRYAFETLSFYGPSGGTAYAADLKSAPFKGCGFEAHLGYQTINRIQQTLSCHAFRKTPRR